MDPVIFNQLRLGLIFYIILVCSVSIHEWAHAFAADKLGDGLPRAQGRVTLNPLAHMDFLGTFILPLLMILLPIFTGNGAAVIFGWGKPVMLSLPNPKTRRRDDLIITAAGPLSNLVICFFLSLATPFVMKLDPSAVELIYLAMALNAALFVFNLLPIPPLDGSHFLKHAFRMSEETFYRFSNWGFLIILILINLAPFRYVLSKAIYAVLDFFGSIVSLIS